MCINAEALLNLHKVIAEGAMVIRRSVGFPRGSDRTHYIVEGGQPRIRLYRSW